ncbi:MAG: 50S ribosomal protein L18e [Conexivisphaerales archaeon]
MTMDLAASKELNVAYKSTKQKIWKRVSEELIKPGKPKAINVSKIEKLVPEGSAIIFVGKVLGGGTINKKITVGALGFSASGREKINNAGGEAMLLVDFVKKHKNKGGIIIVK